MPRKQAVSVWKKVLRGSNETAYAPRQTANLLTLPLEIRDEIFTFLISEPSCVLLNLLLTNRQLGKEAKPFLYRRPLIFEGQCELLHWLAIVDHQYLKYVSDIRFKLFDINPEKIAGALGIRLREARANRGNGDLHSKNDPLDNPYYEACFHDLKRLHKAFGMLGGVRKLTIATCKSSDPCPPSQMLDAFSKMLGQCFPNLTSLISEEPRFDVDFIANKPRLQLLRFPANTESCEDEITETFRRLPRLRLEICRLSPPRGTQYEWHCISEILFCLPPLRGLVLFERLDTKNPCLLEEVLQHSVEALKRHLRSLQTLSVMADRPLADQPAAIMERNLYRFLEASNLQHVEVIGFYVSAYRHLPSTVESFTLRLDRAWYESASFAESMSELMGHVKFRHITANRDAQIPRLSRLKKIEVWVAEGEELADESDVDDSDDDDDDEGEVSMIRSVKMRLARIGIHFKLVVNPTANQKLTGSEDRL